MPSALPKVLAAFAPVPKLLVVPAPVAIELFPVTESVVKDPAPAPDVIKQLLSVGPHPPHAVVAAPGSWILSEGRIGVTGFPASAKTV